MIITDNNRAIFIQIADLICDRLLIGYYNISDRCPSVRELAAELQVNPNTVIRSYERLQNYKIIYNKRGIGFYFEIDSKDKITKLRHLEFISKKLPALFNEMSLLNITIQDIVNAYSEYEKGKISTIKIIPNEKERF